ncbi:MAG: hypothetical protein LBD16_04785, partial [Oscillospiraceae bacterium]|nr:hypothetical protein [Oscillospiraceae bacterium]
VSTIYAPEYYINTETDKVVLPDQRGKPNIKEWVLGYGSVNAWHEDIHQFLPRYQSLSHAREQNDLWFSSRFQHFKQDETYLIDTVDIWKYYDENSPWDQIELEEGVTGGGPGYGAKGTAFGVMTSLPFDQHFLMSLVAPRGLLVQVGYEDDWNNSESMAFGYYATKGTFEFLQVPENIGIATGDYGHAYGADQARKLVAFANYIMQPQGEIYENKQTFTVYPYPTNDIRRKSDYDKINWTVPGTEAK